MRSTFLLVCLFIGLQSINSAYSYQSINANPKWITFGDQKINTSSFNQIVSILNTGNESIPMIQTSVFGNSSQFRVINTCGNLMPYQTCILYVVFNPSIIAHSNISINIYGGMAFDTVNAEGNGVQ